MLLIVSVLTGCSVATDTPNSAPVTGSNRTGPTNSAQIGGPVASSSPSLDAASVVGAGSFPRSFLTPRTDTSIRVGGS